MHDHIDSMMTIIKDQGKGEEVNPVSSVCFAVDPGPWSAALPSMFI